MIDPTFKTQHELDTWLVDLSGNIASSHTGLALLTRINALLVPAFVSTEHAVEWGSLLSAEQHETLVDIQRTFSNAARGERNLQRMVKLATRSQLIREAAEAFAPRLSDKRDLLMPTLMAAAGQ